MEETSAKQNGIENHDKPKPDEELSGMKIDVTEDSTKSPNEADSTKCSDESNSIKCSDEADSTKCSEKADSTKSSDEADSTKSSDVTDSTKCSDETASTETPVELKNSEAVPTSSEDAPDSEPKPAEEVTAPRRRGRKRKINPETDSTKCSDVTDSTKYSDETGSTETPVELKNSEAVPTSSEDTPDSEPKPADGEEVKAPRRRGRKRKIYDMNDDPETIKEKRKKRAVELRLKHLRWTLGQNNNMVVVGKRQIKTPERFELAPKDKRKSCMDDYEGDGQQLGNIQWIHTQIQNANLEMLRLLHRTLFRKQGMWAEKQIKKMVVKFAGFPFDMEHEEIRKRREQLERANLNSVGSLCDMLALQRGSRDEMIDRILQFLMRPSSHHVEAYLQKIMAEKLQAAKAAAPKIAPVSSSVFIMPRPSIQPFMMPHHKEEGMVDVIYDEAPDIEMKVEETHWNKPAFFAEGNGVKLKYIRAVASSIKTISEAFVELIHRLLYIEVDEKENMRRNILEFSGLTCEVGSSDYSYRMKILAVLPVEQVKLICRVLCLPTWHRSRTLLTEGIMDFLTAPRISVMKKRVPPHFTDEISFTFDAEKVSKAVIPELKSHESEEIEIVPDIHIPMDGSPTIESEMHVENEYLGVKLKNFSNIHYQVISTPAAKLSDVHMILYLTTCALNNVRKNVLEFAGFPFDENTKEFQCRRNLMEQMTIDELKTVATVLCVSQYIVDESKNSLIDAILKFLLKPSALLNNSTIMPTITPPPVPMPRRSPIIIKKKATSTSITPHVMDITPEIVISEVKTLSPEKDATSSLKDAISSSNTTSREGSATPELSIMKSILSSDIQIMPIPSKCNVKREETNEADEPLSKVKNEVSVEPVRPQYVESDDEDDKPLSKMIGHPNDEQLRLLVHKIVKESNLGDITMKLVIRKVFDTFPNYDLAYRKEFIKSIVRQILSQMDDQNCSVTTTVITI